MISAIDADKGLTVEDSIFLELSCVFMHSSKLSVRVKFRKRSSHMSGRTFLCIACISELLIAYLAYVAFFTGMYPHMASQIACISELLIAYLAYVIVCISELLIAYLACVILFTSMHRHMAFQIASIFELHIAYLACVVGYFIAGLFVEFQCNKSDSVVQCTKLLRFTLRFAAEYDHKTPNTYK
ncbi:unnamed protein product [Cercopithifilaria johnstoni]|uniref:Uncharacterized protein n=1 Tax=Cercopithifilaria johnstoni TaxID=2874296 RepID=A0A8J2MB00_9BILA|nr:unnamed protein product [Cercopithifilaria johnstoni]